MKLGLTKLATWSLLIGLFSGCSPQEKNEPNTEYFIFVLQMTSLFLTLEHTGATG